MNGPTPTSDTTPATPPPVDPPARPRRARLAAPLYILAGLALLYTAWLAGPLIVPVLVAIFLALVGNPVVRIFERLWIPRWIGSLGVIFGGLAALALLANVLVEPAAEWVQQAPSEVRQHAPKLRALTAPFEEASSAASESLLELSGRPQPVPEAAEETAGNELWAVLSGTPITLASVGAILLLSYFFLVFGGSLQQRVVALFPDRARKRVTVDILRTVQVEVSRYVFTITVINLVLGVLTAVALWLIGLDIEDALLWGFFVALLNYAPYVGPLVAAIALTLVGMVAFDELWHALMVPAAYLALNVLEGQFLTPIILGQRMRISPLILLLWLLLWGWIWGVVGLLLAVPMLVTLKIIASRVEGWQGWASVMER
jgi:predicted PurR-regulated permease PerM